MAAGTPTPGTTTTPAPRHRHRHDTLGSSGSTAARAQAQAPTHQAEAEGVKPTNRKTAKPKPKPAKPVTPTPVIPTAPRLRLHGLTAAARSKVAPPETARAPASRALALARRRRGAGGEFAAVRLGAGEPGAGGPQPRHRGVHQAQPGRRARRARSMRYVRSPASERCSRWSRPGTDAHGEQWLEVLLPGRPDSHTGWIEASAVSPGDRLADRRPPHHAAGRGVCPRPRRPHLPRGRRQALDPDADRAFLRRGDGSPSPGSGAPFALALSARSNALAQFDGGPGQVALHGIANIGGTPGTAVSHGCVRLTTADIAWLGEHISSGVPVTILA